MSQQNTVRYSKLELLLGFFREKSEDNLLSYAKYTAISLLLANQLVLLAAAGGSVPGRLFYPKL